MDKKTIEEKRRAARDMARQIIAAHRIGRTKKDTAK